jgi:hypothetical protein
MPSPKELRAQLAEARAEFQAALHEVHAKWDQKPAGGEGEDAWSPKEVAQHVIGADRFFTNNIAQACGAPAMDRPPVDVSTPGAAAASFTRIATDDDAVLRHVSDGDLAKTHETRLGVLSVEQLLTGMTSHLRDHTAQLRAAGA